MENPATMLYTSTETGLKPEDFREGHLARLPNPVQNRWENSVETCLKPVDFRVGRDVSLSDIGTSKPVESLIFIWFEAGGNVRM